MQFVRHSVVITCAALLSIAALADSAFAQPPGQPGQPQVQVNGTSIVISFAPASGATAYSIAASFNGVTLPGSPFFVGGLTTIPAAGLATGSYTIQVIAHNASAQTASVPTTFIIGGGGGTPGTPTVNPPTVTGSAVTLTWNAVANATGYDVEAIVQATGQTFFLPVGNQTSLFVPNVPIGNYLVRVRGRNAFGVGAYSAQVLVVVGIVLGQGDLQVTLTWNSTADIDLHIIEPDGTHVYFASDTGVTTFLDVDDIDGFGPENIFVKPGGAAAGTYQIFVVHFGLDVPTTSTIAVTLRGNTSAPQTALFTRQTAVGDPLTGFNVASVNLQTGQVVETTGARSAGFLGSAPVKTSKK